MPRNALAATIVLGLLSLAPPAMAQQEISKVNGSIVAQAGRAYGDVGTVNGSITIESGATVADAETVNGGIRAGSDIGAHSLSTVNGGINAGQRANVQGSVETVNGDIFLDRGGRVGGSIETVNGSIGLVDVDLGGGIETVSGDVTVGIGSHVSGGLRVNKPTSNWFPIQLNKRKPRIIIGPDAVVEGELVFERDVTLYVHERARTGKVTGATATPYRTPRAPGE